MTRENNCKERLLLTETGMLEWVGGQGAGGIQVHPDIHNLFFKRHNTSQPLVFLDFPRALHKILSD